jgi:hypothetical protein
MYSTSESDTRRRVSVLLEENLHRQLIDYAKHYDRSLSGASRLILREHLSRWREGRRHLERETTG